MRGELNGLRVSGIVAATLAIFVMIAPAAPAEAAGGGVGQVRLAGAGDIWELLVPMNLPMEVSGRKVTGRITIDLPRTRWTRKWKATVHAGTLRQGDRRNRFSYVRGIRISPGLTRALKRHGAESRATVQIRYELPSADPEIERGEASGATQPGIRRARPGFCETLSREIAQPPGNSVRSFLLPTCGARLDWRVTREPQKGTYKKYLRSLNYRVAPGQSGADELELAGYFKGRLVATQRVQFRIARANPSNVSVVALGDSVTAGFGYFGSTGKQMSLSQLIDCRPGATVFNDACSSNSSGRNSSVGTKPAYLSDFGLSRNISWAAQWANEYGITDYANYAVTGSAPSDWLPGGQFASTLQSIEAQNPKYILLTMGANPLLSDVLFGVDNMGCALESDLFGDFRQCVLDAFAAVDLDQKLNQLYASLVQNTSSKIVVMQYHLAVPSTAIAYSATQLEAMTELLNEVIADEADQVSPGRITVVLPPRFDVGIDMEPLYPSKFSCSFLGFQVDGPSVQATISQDELEVDHPLSFCSGPAIGQPWIISGDTGIHPSAAGYFQMASQVPAPGS
ncbi:MAG: hypothetical protein J0H98_09520 [Solirubrobacterales bacterium]|nr:hypothetical protein [Solirubrobacterales bacterium]